MRRLQERERWERVAHQYDYEQHTEVLLLVAVMVKEEEEEEEEDKAAQRIIRKFDPR
jgi:hypothetical protein